MQEVFYEESVSTENLKSARVKFNIVRLIGIISIILGIVFTIVFITAVDLTSLFQVVFFLVLTAGSYVLGIVYLRKKDNFLLDYDYTFVTGSVRISKIMNSKRRKLIAHFNTTEIIKMGKYMSETYEKIQKDTQTKKIIATPNNTAGEGRDFYYIQFSAGGQKKVIVLECTETLMYHILKTSSKTVLESDFK